MLKCSNFGVSLEVRTQNLICLKKLNCCILNRSFTPSVYRLSHIHYNCKLLICFWVPSNKIVIHMMDVLICHCVWCVLLNGGKPVEFVPWSLHALWTLRRRGLTGGQEQRIPRRWAEGEKLSWSQPVWSSRSKTEQRCILWTRYHIPPLWSNVHVECRIGSLIIFPDNLQRSVASRYLGLWFHHQRKSPLDCSHAGFLVVLGFLLLCSSLK